MPEYRVRYIVGHDIIGRAEYHSVTVESDEPPTIDQALDVAFLQESHMYDKGEFYDGSEIEVDDIRELMPLPPIITRTRVRYNYNYDTEEWEGPLFEGATSHQ